MTQYSLIAEKLRVFEMKYLKREVFGRLCKLRIKTDVLRMIDSALAQLLRSFYYMNLH